MIEHVLQFLDGFGVGYLLAEFGRATPTAQIAVWDLRLVRVYQHDRDMYDRLMRSWETRLLAELSIMRERERPVTFHRWLI